MNTLPRSPSHASQQGSVVVILAIAIGMLIALLGSIQIGYTAYMKRDLQKIADMAALSGVQNLEDGGCSGARTTAQAIASANDNYFMSHPPHVQCGTWDHKPFFESSSNINAVKVTLERAAPSLLPLFKQSSLAAHATATNAEPVAAFSLGSRLLSLAPDGLVHTLLKGLLADADLTVLDSTGVANARLTPAGLLAATNLINSDIDLGTATPQQLLDLAPVKVGDLLLASTTLVGSQLADLDIEALNTIAAALNAKNMTVKLFGDGDQNQGILVLDTLDTQSALQTQISLANLIGSSILIANGENAIEIPFTDLNLGLLSASADAYVVAPPTIAIGGRWTKAHNAQARVNLHLKENTGLTGLNLNLQLELAQADATITGLACNAKPGRDQATFDTETSLAGLCIIPAGAGDDYVCSDNSGAASKIEILNVLGIIPVSVTPKTNLLPITAPNTTSITLDEPPPVDGSTQTLKAKALSLTELTAGLVNTVLGDIVGSILGNSTLTAQNKYDASRKLLATNNNDVGQVQQALEQANAPLTALRNDESGFISSTLQATVGGLLGIVGSIVNGLTDVLSNLLKGIICILGLCHEPTLSNKIDAVQGKLFGTSAEAGKNGLATLTVSLLSPLLTPLDNVLSSLLDTLGLNVAEADLKLQSVQCGLPRLVE